MANYNNLKELAYSGNEDVLCVYIDIKSAITRLPYQYKYALVQALIYDNKGISEDTVDTSLDFLVEILNG